MFAPTRPGARDLQRTRTLPDKPPGKLGEFELIARDLRPLAGDGARALADDVALFAGHAVTTDTICAGVHFFADDPLDTVAQKVVRVNVSDLVAKGCRPAAMTLACAWHAHASADDHAAFAQGLASDLARYGIALLGGDTTRLQPGQGPVFTVTMFGDPLGDNVPSRAGAGVGDIVYVTGTIGDAWLGLQARHGVWQSGDHAAAVEMAYLLPKPPLSAAPMVARYAVASIDVSDGLIADARHIAQASGVSLRLFADRIPLSDAGRRAISDGVRIEQLCTGGDDYQAMVVVPATDAVSFEKALQRSDVTVARIGLCEAGRSGVLLEDPERGAITPRQGGWRHDKP